MRTKTRKPGPFDPDYVSPHGVPPPGVRGDPDAWAAAFKARFTDEEIKERLGDDNPWEILGIAVGSDTATIKSAYRKRAKETHPDWNPGKTQKDFEKVQAAYEQLMKGR